MNIVYSLTADYIHKAIPSIKSLLHYNPSANIFMLTEVDEVDLPITVINVKNQKWFKETDVNFHNYFTYVNLLKVCYPSILPLDKVIHLDADTIICDTLEPMWEIDLSGKWIAACPEYRGSYRLIGDTYYNMGVAVINLAQMREDNIQPKLVKYLNSFQQPFADQDAWNKYAVEENKVVKLPVRYNESVPTFYTENPAIVHYCGITDWYENKTMYRVEYLNKWRNE